MGYVKLYITDYSAPQLYATRFAHRRLRGEILAVRGKTGAAFSSEHTFQWTIGVRALSVLLLRSAAYTLSLTEQSVSCLEGERGSIAMSLENALGNETTWLIDMFGLDEHGVPLLRRLFKRGNPDQKRPGPVSVSLSRSEWSEIPIHVFVGDTELDQPELLLRMADAIERTCRLEGKDKPKPKKEIDSLSKEADLRSWQDWFPQVLFREIREMLAVSDIFNPSQVARTVAEINENESFQRISGRHSLLLSSIDCQLLSGQRLGVAGNEASLKAALCPQDPIRVAIPATIPASAALFCYLRQIKGYNILIDMSEAHTIELSKKLASNSFSNPPDACCLAIAPAAGLLSQGSQVEYLPMMMMPKISQRIVGKKGSSKGRQSLSSGRYLFIEEDPSVPLFVFDDLVRKGFIAKSAVNVTHMEPDEVLKHLKDADSEVRAILFFPHYHFNKWFNDCELIPDPREELSCQECFLFVSRKLIANEKVAQALDIALRDAWLELKTNDQAVHQVVDALLADQRYLKYVSRFAGLHNLVR